MVLGCARPRYGASSGPDPAAALARRPPMALDQVWLIERGGSSPDDTVVTFRSASGRTVVLRHPAPDNATFAVLRVAADSSNDRERTLTLTPTPGRYGLTVTIDGGLPEGTTLLFSYAAHFVAPAEAIVRYPTLTQLERGIGVGRLRPDSLIEFVAATRPAADMLMIPLTASGRYLLAAPR